jgi:hypothetical protein
VAARQHGVVSRRQLHECGLTDRAIATWLRAGRLHRVHRGVYALGHAALSQEGRWMAAVLACGRAAVLSHRSAAHLWGLLARSPSLADVTTPRPGGRVEGVRRHRTRRLEEHDVTEHYAIPVTTVERTLVDLADVAPDRVVRRALHQAEIAYGVTRSPINGRRGANRLSQPPDRTRSVLEREFGRLCETHGIARPENNASVAGLEVDFVWRAQRVVVELDGWAFHRTRHAFERDRERDQALAREGFAVLRFTHRQVTERAWDVARTVRAALASPR